MTDSTETPSLFPEESIPKKPARRKPAAPRKPRAVKSAEAPVAKKTAAKATKTTRPVRKKAVKKVVEPVEAATAVMEAPVIKAPAVVLPAPVKPVAVPAPQPVVIPEPVVQAAPQPVAEPERTREPRDRREPREGRGGRGRNQRNDRRSRDRQPQPRSPQPPSAAGAVAEEWSPRSRRNVQAPAREAAAPASEPVAQPVPVPPANKPEELIIPRRANRENAQQQMSREERIAAARRQLASAELSPETAEAVSEPPLPEQPRPEPVFGEGIVEVSGKGFGFLRDPKRNFAQHPSDIFVTPEVCRRYALRDGMWIRGEIRRGNRGPQLFRLTELEGEDPEQFRNLPRFEELTTLNPNRFIKLETVPDRFTTRVIDLMAPIGRGQRGLIVAPPRTGKTTLLEHIADAVTKNHPDIKLIILLVDERPEEVTEIRRSMPGAELMASSNDQEIKSHTRICQLAIERARRLVEMGKHVFILLDSITRVGRAFNNATSGGGRTMSGGVDARALEIPRKLFASARNTEEAGSLTIIATALIETGSRMDDLIFQEFKGTGNMELVLDRKISDLRIYPAVDIFLSGTRREELLLPEADLLKINTIRRGLSGHKPAEAIERLLFFLNKFPTNAQMLREIPG
jgi:transcription termination factor Rho